MRFKVVITGYNCGDYIGKCLASLESQTYTHYDVCVIDDASTDPRMRPSIEKFCERNGWKALFNQKNRKGMATMVQAVEALECEEEDVIVILDGDDWLFDEYVLEKVAKIYKEGDVWLTYGGSINYGPGTLTCAALPKPRWIRKRLYRKNRWLFTHFRTFKAFLWNNIRDEDLRGADGEYWKATSDMATMFPMMEMAGSRFRCLKELHYVYNDGNPLNDDKAFSDEQQKCDKLIRAMPPYPTLT